MVKATPWAARSREEPGVRISHTGFFRSWFAALYTLVFYCFD